ncbi:MAG TPA: hypothetical protein VFB96_23050 [Pirellulaceae bacterium]|nr:hypothetical protein [Pirellulaceae bacterium]
MSLSFTPRENELAANGKRQVSLAQCEASDDTCRFFYGGRIVAKKKAAKKGGAKKAAKKKKK